MRMIQHAPDADPRSVQLYGVDPATVIDAVRLPVDEDRTDHIDLNFGCPVPKVTRKGGGAALPWKLDLFAAIVRGAVHAASPANIRSEEHTSELQSRGHLVCRLLLEKKKIKENF